MATTRLFLLSLFGFCTVISAQHPPIITIITSVYDGDQFIEGFLHDITQQTIFDHCELIMINAHSPGNEESVVFRYMVQYPNMVYKKLSHDPGLYAVWNMAIKMARGEFITNANLDDRLRFDCYEKHLQVLRANPHVDLVYSDFYVTYYPNETFTVNRHRHVRTMPHFTVHAMKEPLPNNHPLWRKSFHEKYGLFDESFKHAGDYEMWLRAVELGAFFMKVEGIFGLYYVNPNGLSTSLAKDARIKQEEARIFERYGYLFNLRSSRVSERTYRGIKFD